MLKNKKILLGITGGIAAYKAAYLASKLTSLGCQVKTIMTSNACKFIQPLTIKSITHQSVTTQYFNHDADIEHISLADWADLTLIAPATANLIGKVAGGIADDLLSTTIMATTSPVLFVPAMNVHMYENPILQRNIQTLVDLDYYFLEPETGQLACGYEGKGRFPEVEETIYHVETYLSYKKDLQNKSILITTGATREKLDPMRFFTNYSSGLMGLALARASYIRGARVKVIAAHIDHPIPYYLKVVRVNNAQEMYEQTIAEFPGNKFTFMVAAVSDYTPSIQHEQKLKKDVDLYLKLARTKDVLAELGKLKQKDQKLIGFAAETNDIRENARRKMNLKNLDFIIANNLKVAGKNDTEIFLISSTEEKNIKGSKFEVAHQVLDQIFHGK